ncbi:uncharacterized protein LOC123445708 [Hordeum vulgare subsp. vulgare]|uniref:Uncharacterized protein n=1 Tax=Hordeum vulgare subsp. vulgare TaxID=112509 RepID=A0A8I6X867_HORVV|nr:uncharacterized protein LOC123445708 [Hordeum vulgare subsp. vulgare]
MAVEWSDGGEEFLLPDEFLDDDFFSEEEKAAVAARSESDEEDSLAGLARRLASLLAGDGLPAPTAKEEVVAGSPKSTLCGLPKSGQESPNSGASQGNSPPSSPLEQQPADPWDVLYEAEGHAARMRVNSPIPVPGNPYGLHGRGMFVPPARKASPPHAPAPAGTAAGGVYYPPFAHLVTQRQIHAARFHLLKQQQLFKQQRDRQLAAAAAWSVRRNAEAKRAGAGPIDLSPASFPPLLKTHLQHTPAPRPTHPPAAGMRAVFLTPPGAKRERAGTGVFLPRPAGFPAEPKKKPSCSTVLVPARVVHALNLNLDDLGSQPRYPGGFVLDHDALISRSNAMLASHKMRAAETSAPHREPAGAV